jgi:hypothetical protein
MNPLLILPLAAVVGLLAGLLYFAHLRHAIARWTTDHASGRLMFGGMVRVIAMVALLVAITRLGGGGALVASSLGFFMARWISLRAAARAS